MLERVAALREQKVIRQISAIFDSRRLGYRGMLVAARTPAERQDAAAAVFSTHPGVSHNYLREHELNLWFTLTVSPRSQLGLDRTVELLGELAEVDVDPPDAGAALLQDRRRPRREGRSRSRGQARQGAPGAPVAAARGADRPRSRRRSAPCSATSPSSPSRSASSRRGIGFETAELLAHGHAFIETGQMRRYAAVLAHRNAGFVQNGMGVWRVPEERLDECGQIMAAFRGVSHCYQRPTYPDWPYNLFSMTHGRTKAECEAVLAAVGERDRARRLLGAVLHARSTRRRASRTSRRRKRRGSRRTPPLAV